MKKITELTAELAAPAIAEQGCTLWDVEYVKEAGTWYLRILLDKEGGVDILDCEEISRKVSDLLDEADPIEGSYTLEVGSAGAERALKRPSDFQQFLGSPVLVKLYRAREGRKEFAGYLKGYVRPPAMSPSPWAARIWSSPRRRLPLSACGWNFNQSPSRQDVFYQQGESAT